MRALARAVSDTNPDAVYFIDSNNGSVMKIGKGAPMSELARFKAESDRDPDRYLRAPRSTSEESYGDIAAFIATVKDKKLQERLQTAVRGGGTMRNFLDSLQPVPAEYDRWHKFREARILGRCTEWVRQNGMETR